MEIFSQSSNYITKLINKFQNNEIDNNTFNKNILINTIFSHFYFKKENKKYKKIKESQNSIFQSFYLLESMQAKNEKQLISKIRDRKSKKIVEESIKSQRQSLLNDLASKKDIKIFADHTFNTYIPPKKISLSLFQNFSINSLKLAIQIDSLWIIFLIKIMKIILWLKKLLMKKRDNLLSANLIIMELSIAMI